MTAPLPLVDEKAVVALQSAAGARVKELRKAQGLSAPSVAASAGVSEKSIRNLESGRGGTTAVLFRTLLAVGAGDLAAALCQEPGARRSAPKTAQRRQVHRLRK